ncbi:hypothetical protein Bbelb_122440 [Branchiostoma belcheri]|nr:hypothetical protein Bbelb_122440 [Branchiostoma belcheri]
MGEEKCKLRAKSAVYWIGMYKEIEKMVQTCRTCKKYQNSQQKEEMTPTETPSRPWKKVGADLFYLNQEWFLLVVDYYSKFPIVKTLKSLKASTVTQAFKGIFAEQGIPDEVICDNGTQFTSQEFRQAAEEYGFRITTSSPYYPKGHGLIERHVQTVKKTLTKSLETGEDPNLALLTLRTTPLRTDTKSPAELLNGRRYKTRLPTKIHPPADQEEVMGKLTAAQEKSKKQYDRQAQQLPELVRGQTVHIQEPIKKTWTPGQIVGKADTPKSYVVETESGKQMRRNRLSGPHPDHDIDETMGNILRAYVASNQRDWDEHLPAVNVPLSRCSHTSPAAPPCRTDPFEMPAAIPPLNSLPSTASQPTVSHCCILVPLLLGSPEQQRGNLISSTGDIIEHRLLRALHLNEADAKLYIVGFSTASSCIRCWAVGGMRARSPPGPDRHK